MLGEEYRFHFWVSYRSTCTIFRYQALVDLLCNHIPFEFSLGSLRAVSVLRLLYLLHPRCLELPFWASCIYHEQPSPVIQIGNRRTFSQFLTCCGSSIYKLSIRLPARWFCWCILALYCQSLAFLLVLFLPSSLWILADLHSCSSADLFDLFAAKIDFRTPLH